MTDQKWNLPGIEQKASELDTEAAAVYKALDEERSEVKLVAGYWGGDGSDGWQSQQSRWQQKADDVTRTLRDLCAAVHHAVDTMNDVESTVTKMFD